MGLLRWLGFVRLADYGLDLTPDGRVRARSFVVLDDGGGGAIVGWAEGDPGVDQLRKWQLVPPRNVATARDDDEWEWMMAAARARARADAQVPLPAPRSEAEARFEDMATQAKFEEPPTTTWVDETEIDPEPPVRSTRLARGTPSPESRKSEQPPRVSSSATTVRAALLTYPSRRREGR
jgi:hypothetical protein